MGPRGSGRAAWSCRIAAAFGIAALVITSGGCGPQATLPDGTFDPIRIGVVTSLTGTLGTDGPTWRDATRLAAQEVNAAGGPLDGRPIELIVLDDETNPATAAGIGQQLVEQGVHGIIGAAASSVTLGLADASTPARIPQISCCSTSDLITEYNAMRPLEERYLFRTTSSDELQARVVAIAAQQLSCTRLAILHLDDSYGQPFGEAIEAGFTAAGGTVAIRVPFADEQASYGTEVQMVSDATPDCIALVAFPGSGGTIARDWAALSGAPDVTWIGTDGVRSGGFVDEAGDPTLIDGFFGTSPVTDAPTPEYNTYRDHFEAVFGGAPIPFSSNQYDALALLSLAFAQAGTTDGPAVRDALREVSAPPADRGIVRAGRLAEGLSEVNQGRDVDYQGASGAVDFDEFGDVISSYEIWRYDAPGVTPCAGAAILPGMRGSFCRFRTITAEELGG
jgi:ABC-type branched-subunit amino acid transport system substrate-binding protein